MPEIKLSGLSPLSEPARGDSFACNDASEPIVAAKTKKLNIETLIERMGSYAEPSAAQQTDIHTALNVLPATVITNADIGGRGGTSWRVTSSTIWGGLPNESSGADNTERRGHALISVTDKVYSLRISQSTLWYQTGVSRRIVRAFFLAMRKGDTLELFGWTNNLGGASLSVPFLIVAAPAYDAATASWLFRLRPVGSPTISSAHLAPSGSSYPTFGVSVGIRAQNPIGLGDATPRPPGTATPGVAEAAARVDHVHPLSGTPAAELTDATNIAWDLAARPNAYVTIHANRTIPNPTNPVSGGFYCIEVIQDSTGGRTLAWGTDFVFTGAGVASGPPPIETGAGKATVYGFRYSRGKMRIIGPPTEDY